MNRRINPHRPSEAHTEAATATTRLNPVAAFRTLLQRMARPVAFSDKDKKGKRGPGSAGGPARGRGGSLDAATDDAVEGLTQGGSGGRQGDEEDASLGIGEGSGAAEGAAFASALDGTAGNEGPEPESLHEPIPLARPSAPVIWPIATLRASWKLIDPPPTPYDARPADATRPNGVPAFVQRWARAASIRAYAPPSVATSVPRPRYRPFAPPLHIPIAIGPVLPRGMALRWRPLGAPVPPFVPLAIPTSAPRRIVEYSLFTPPPSAHRIAPLAGPDRAARYIPFAPLTATAARVGPPLPSSVRPGVRVVVPTRSYASPGPLVAARTEAGARRSYKPPPPHPVDAIKVARPLGFTAGDGRWPPMSIDTLLASPVGRGVGRVVGGGAKVQRVARAT